MSMCLLQTRWILKSTGDNWTSFYAAVILAAVVSYQTGRLTRKGIYVR